MRGLAVAPLTLAILIAAAEPARAAATLFSGGVSVSPGDVITCVAVNASKSVVDRIDITIYAAGDPSVVYLTPSCTDVAPEVGCGLLSLTLGANDFPACKVALTGAAKNAVRATLCNRTTGNCSEAR
jgi:hypothetical protein